MKIIVLPLFWHEEIFLLLCRQSANSCCFIICRNSTVIFTNASLILLICSSFSPSAHGMSQHSELRAFWVFFSSFFTKEIMSFSSSWKRILGHHKITTIHFMLHFKIFLATQLHRNMPIPPLLTNTLPTTPYTPKLQPLTSFPTNLDG